MLGLLLPAVLTFVTRAESAPGEFSRAGKLELAAFGQSLTGGNTVSGFGGAASLKLDSGYGGGLALGYNLTDHFNVNTEIVGSALDVKLNALGVPLSPHATLLGWNVNLDYNILKSRFTPLITGGVGLTRIFGDFQVAGSEFAETDLSWGVGGGARWDITDRWFMRAVYRANWTLMKDTDSAPMTHTVTLGVGFKF